MADFFVDAGELNRRIQILRKTEQSDSAGYLAPETEPEVVHTCWAKFSQTSGSSIQKANADWGEVKVRFLIRHTKKKLNRKMVVRFGGLDYEIEYINTYGDSRRYTELWCKLGSQKGELA